MKYTFCLRCGGEFEQKLHNLLVCKKCGFNFYLNPAPTTAVIIENEKGEILLVKRKFDPKKGTLDLPGGFIEPDESLEEGLLREIKEELGVEIYDLTYFISYPDDYLFKGVNYKILGITYTAKIKEGENISASDDIDEAKYYKKEDIPFDQIAFENIKKALLDYLNKKA